MALIMGPNDWNKRYQLVYHNVPNKKAYMSNNMMLSRENRPHLDQIIIIGCNNYQILLDIIADYHNVQIQICNDKNARESLFGI